MADRFKTHRFRRAARRFGSLLMTCCLALALGFQVALPARADDRQQELEAEKNRLQQELDAIKEQREENQENLESAEASRADAQARQDVLVQKVAVIADLIAELETQIGETEDAITAKQAEIEAKQEEFDARWAGFKERMVSMQKLNDQGGIALLSSATNLFQLLTISKAMANIAEEDRAVCTDLNNQKAELETERQELEDQKATLEAQEASAADQRSQLESAQNELASTIQELDSSISAAEAQEQALAAAQSDKQAEFDKAAEELDSYLRSLISQAQDNFASAPISCSLNFICPLDSYKYISCQYGSGGHKGVDFAAPGGTPIRAIAAGQVITSTYHSSYGNYVMVYHGTDDQGNTYASLYAHMISTPAVGLGQDVAQGDVLGYVGSTGNSTGNHLHLELRVNGARTNALNYVPH